MRSKKENVTDETIERKATATAAGPPPKQTQSPEPKKMKGPQQQTLRDVVNNIEADDKRRKKEKHGRKHHERSRSNCSR